MRDSEGAKTGESGTSMKLEQRLYFRDQFRAERALALKDAEGFDGIIHCLERLGSYLTDADQRGLDAFKDAIGEIAVGSPHAAATPDRGGSYHIPFDELYDSVRLARNDAVHEGAAARHLTEHAVQLSLMIEDGLMAGTNKARDFMVSSPTTADAWEPVSFVRQKMLLNSYSFVPLSPTDANDSWTLLSDRAIVHYLRGEPGESISNGERQRRLRHSVGDAIAEYGLELEAVTCCYPEDPITKVLDELDHVPVLVCEDGSDKRLLGIITAFDLL